MGSATITAETRIDRNPAHVRCWFIELEAHPERYRFETHTGLTFTQGGFGTVGARFQTRERFCGLRIALRFELTEVGDAHFRFRLLDPPLPIWGAFAIDGIDGAAVLRLAVGGINRLGCCFLRLPLVRGAIRRQIRAEVTHIRTSIEATR